MAHLISTTLKKQINWWQWFSIVAPISFLVGGVFSVYTNISSLIEIIYFGCFLFGLTCLAWWHWCLYTMIRMLSIMKDTDEHFEKVTGELAQLRIALEKETVQYH